MWSLGERVSERESVCERKRGAVGKREIILDTEPIMFYSSAQEEGKVKARVQKERTFSFFKSVQ